MQNALIIDKNRHHAERIAELLADRQVESEIAATPAIAGTVLQDRAVTFDLIVLNVADRSGRWLDILDELHEACTRGGFTPPQFLCVSETEWEPSFELAIERWGARYAFER